MLLFNFDCMKESSFRAEVTKVTRVTKVLKVVEDLICSY
jgi:hypothetical protein